MIVFKTFLKILNRCKFLVILYTAILVLFGVANFKSGNNVNNFVTTKPDILIVNKDKNTPLTNHLIKYLSKNCNIKNIKKTSEAIDDALFYREVNYVVYIPKNFNEDFKLKKIANIKIKSTGDYNATLANMILERYLNLANIYIKDYSVDEVIKKLDNNLKTTTKIQIESKLDSDNLEKATTYYNFVSYSFLAGLIYVVTIILSSFNQSMIQKRTNVSSMNYKKINRYLLLSNSLFAVFLWLIYVVLSIVLIGSIMISLNGLMYILNSFIFMVCTLTIAFLIANVVNNKGAINGIVNVVALGSSFLCGAFVPFEFLPDIVLKIAHILPTYWYVRGNEYIKKLEVFNLETLKPLFFYMAMVLVFALIFIVCTNIIANKKRVNN